MKNLTFTKTVLVSTGLLSFCAGLTAAEQESGVNKRPAIETIVVTATKRETDLQDTAASISALGGAEIDAKSLVSMEDYLNSLPSVNYLNRGVGNNQIIIRGIALAFAERSTVGTYFGEAPLSNPIISTSSDMKLVDMERIEVLRGPQGTLYGGSAMSGAIRNIPKAPDLAELQGKINVEYSNTDGADGGNGNLTGVLNIPLVEDQLALRMVGYRFHNAGYVNLVSDDVIEARAASLGVPVAIEKGVGSNDYSGIRGLLLWTPNEKLDVTLMMAYQELEEDGRNDITISRNDYEASALDTGKEFKSDDLQLYNLVVNYDLGWGTVTSSTSKIIGDTADSSDLGRVIGWAAVGYSDRDKEGFVEELRFTSQLEGNLQFTAGLYYEDFESYEKCCWRWTGEDNSLNPFGDRELRVVNTLSTIEQKAVFGEINYQANDWLSLVVGGRWFDYDREDDIDESGPLAAIPSTLSTSESDTRFKAGVDIQPNDDMLLYALWSEGFRLGLGVATASPDICDLDNDGLLDGTTISLGASSLGSDTTENLEVGGKFSFWEDRVKLNTAIYRIDWEDIPVGAVGSNPVCSATVNGGEARSQGIELETEILLTANLYLQLAASYTDTEYRNDLLGSVGERLPMSPEYNGHLGLQYNFELLEYPSFVRTDVTYVGDFTTGSSIAFESGDYTTLDINAGVTLNNVDLGLFVSNLTNEDDVTVSFFLDRGWRLRPRTFGVQLGYRF